MTFVVRETVEVLNHGRDGRWRVVRQSEFAFRSLAELALEEALEICRVGGKDDAVDIVLGAAYDLEVGEWAGRRRSEAELY